MGTYRLEAEETMRLKDEKGFAIVVEGAVQIFARSGFMSSVAGESRYEYQDATGQKYQLLNEVKKGGKSK
jgi:hypothetical protein